MRGLRRINEQKVIKARNLKQIKLKKIMEDKEEKYDEQEQLLRNVLTNVNKNRDEIKELHTRGFVHRDLKRPSEMKGFAFDNIFLTDKGIRLIDVGISALKNQVGEKLFQKYMEQEAEELKLFRDFFLNR